jgi:putative nucleotidyltransferase with HDIG domain
VAEQSQHDPWAAGRLTAGQLEDLLHHFDSLTVPPTVSAAVLEAMGQPPSSGAGGLSGELLDIIQADPVLTARVLSLASPATSVASAAGQLSAEAVCTELLAMTAGGEVAVAEGGAMGPRQLQRHSLAVALAAQMLASHLEGQIDPQEAYTAGLLHDVGKLVLACCLPKSFARAAELAAAARGDISDTERQVIGADHATVGHRLAERYRLAPLLTDVIWLHHQPPEGIPAAACARMIELVALADAVARTLQLGFSGNYVFRPSVQDQARRLGLTGQDLDEIFQQLPPVLRRHDRLADFLPQDAQAEARRHRSLGLLATRLAAAHRQVRAQAQTAEVQAEAFRHLRKFAAAIGGQSSVAEALGRITELVADICGWRPSADRPVMAYAVGQAGEAVEMLRHEGARKPVRLAGATPWQARRTLRPNLNLKKSPPVLPADGSTAQVLAELLADPQDLADWLDLSACRHWPLVCAGRWVGGVLLPGSAVNEPVAAMLESVAAAVAMALAVVQGKCRAVLLSEQLAEASQVQAAAQHTLSETRMVSALGELAAGAAHELNNPLAVISGRAQLMHDKAPSTEERKTWSLIADQAQRISNILTALMELASPPPPQPAAINAFDLLKSAAEAFSSSSHPQAASAQVDIEVGDDTPPAWADAAQIRSVIVEAITNAATAADGPLHVRLSARRGDEEQSVLLIVSDDGPGMDAATLEQVFTPFYSLQRAGRRLGLGLPRARRYVENNAGKIWITSTKGRGTQLHVRLPQA